MLSSDYPSDSCTGSPNVPVSPVGCKCPSIGYASLRFSLFISGGTGFGNLPVGPCTRDVAAFFSVLLSAVLFGRFSCYTGGLRRRLNVTDCGGDPVPCLLRYSIVGNLPKCVFVGDRKPPFGPCTRDIAAFFSVLLSAVLFGRFSVILGMAPAASDCNGLWRGPSALSA